MLKNRKMSFVITGTVSVIVAIGMIILYILANNNLTKAMKQDAFNNMQTSLESQAKIIEQYVEAGETLLHSYAQAPIVREVLKNQEDEELNQKVIQYTVDYYNQLNNWEGVYVGNWETHTIAHPAPPVIGMVMREGERLK